MKSQTTSGTHKYKPGQLVTINHHVFRIVKNKSNFTDCYMCDLDSYKLSGPGIPVTKEWCKYCINNLHCCYFKLIK